MKSIRIIPLRTTVSSTNRTTLCTDVIKVVTTLGFSCTFKSTARATCHEDDKINPIVGERIARSRAQYKNYLKAQKFINTISNSIKTELDEYSNRINELVEKEELHIKELIKS